MKAGWILLLLLSMPIVSLSQTASSSEKPADVEILKFSWAEAPPKTTVASSRSSDNVFDASGSGSRRIDTDRTDKTNVPSVSSPKPPKAKIVEYIFRLSIQNTGNKIIQNVRWGYFLYPTDPTAEAFGWLFETKTRIEPGKKKSLQDTGFLMGDLLSKFNKPSNAPFNDKALILHVDYGDGSTWDNPSTYQNIQIFPSRKR